MRNQVIPLHGMFATTTGNEDLTDDKGAVTTVDKTWTFMREPDGAIRIVLHHSSLPVAAAKSDRRSPLPPGAKPRPRGSPLAFQPVRGSCLALPRTPMASPMSAEEAFAAIALAAVACDGRVTPHEAGLLRSALEGRHPYRERSEQRMGALFEGLLNQLQAGGWSALVRQAIPALNRPQRETALAMAAHLIRSDREVGPEEGQLLVELARLMALPEGRAEQLLEAIAVLNNDSLAP